MGRIRLTPDERRSQLLDLGAELFATLPFEEVHIERVAELAGVSRGLLYHYFPTKRAFFADLVRRGTARMAADTEPDPTLSPVDQLSLGVERYLHHVQANEHGSRAIYRGALSADAEVQEVITESMRVFEDRIVVALQPDGQVAELVRVAVRSWILMMRHAGQELLDHPEIPLEQIRELCVTAFVGMMLALPEPIRPSRVAELVATPA
jgi:AcrR family transcriptional regulator